jgi:hypothetical protein
MELNSIWGCKGQADRLQLDLCMWLGQRAAWQSLGQHSMNPSALLMSTPLRSTKKPSSKSKDVSVLLGCVYDSPLQSSAKVRQLWLWLWLCLVMADLPRPSHKYINPLAAYPGYFNPTLCAPAPDLPRPPHHTHLQCLVDCSLQLCRELLDVCVE